MTVLAESELVMEPVKEYLLAWNVLGFTQTILIQISI